MKAKDVFTPGRFPTVTYVDEHLKEKEKQLKSALEIGAVLVSISGPSKSGKTVFVERCLGKENLLQITGAGVTSAADLWLRVFDLIGTPISITKSQGEFKDRTTTEAGGISGHALFAKGRVDVSASQKHGSSENEATTSAIDPLQLLIRELGGSGLTIFIDDFHYIPTELQAELARQIKEAIRNAVSFITASVPYHSDDALRGNADLHGRVSMIDFDYWKPETLKKIAIRGFRELNIVEGTSVVDELASEAAGSPQLMQFLCLNSCFELGVRERSESPVDFRADQGLFEKICRITATSADFGSVVERMKDGPKTRGANRNVYQTRFGWQGDVYRLLAKALSLNPPQLTFRYNSLIDRITSICASDAPSGSSVTSACHHAAQIVNDMIPSIVVEWDGENDVLDIRDPYFLFYLRWADAVDG
jgi:hypothetical protein